MIVLVAEITLYNDVVQTEENKTVPLHDKFMLYHISPCE